MTEGRDQPPERESGPPALLATTGQLSPVQQAQRRRHIHASHCKQCADIDRQRCTEGEQLWKDWTAALEDAYRRLNGSR
jgi:hypothetical protein